MSGGLFAKNEKPLSINDLIARVNFFEGGSLKSISISDLEMKEIWEDEGCRTVLTELFYQSVSHDELLESFTSIMTDKQQRRANISASKYNADPNVIIEREEFTRFSPYDAESFLYRALLKLKSNSLVKVAAVSPVSNNIYYSLTELGREKVVNYLFYTFKNDYILFMPILNHYLRMTRNESLEYQPEDLSVPIMTLFMKYIEQKYTDVDQLIGCFTSHLYFEQIIEMYMMYLQYMEGETKHELNLKKELIRAEVFQKLHRLIENGLIISNPNEGIYEVTQRGLEVFGRIFNQFQSSILLMDEMHLVQLQTAEDSSLIFGNISLTNNGKIVAEKIKNELVKDEYLIMNLTDDYDYHDKYLIPVADEIVRLKQIEKEGRKIKIYIPKKNIRGFKYTLMNKITSPTLIGLSFFSAPLLLMFFFLYGGGVAILWASIAMMFLSLTLFSLRNRWLAFEKYVYESRYIQTLRS